MRYPLEDEVKPDAAGGGGAATPTAGAPAPEEAPPQEKAPSEPPPAETPTEGETPPAEKPADKRFSELTKSERKARQEADDAKRQLGQALEAIERLSGRPAAPEAKKADEENPEPAMPEFQDPAQYQREMSVWAGKMADRAAGIRVKAELAESEKKRLEESRKTNSERIRADWVTRRDEAMKVLPDYAEVAEAPDLNITDHMSQAIVTDSDGPYIAHYLGLNPSEATRISKLPPGQQLVEIGMVKAKVLAARASSKKTNALPPIKPQGGGGSQTKPKEDLPMDEYARTREAEIAASRRPGAH